MLKIRPIMIVTLLFLLVSMLLNPSAAASAAAHGLSLWWQIIAPSLLPFFISFELLLNLGLGNVLGRLLEPIMRPVFALPGTAALGVAMGFCAGFPTGAAIAAALRNQGEITAAEGERLIAFTNNASPLYLSVGVAAGILHCPQAALLLMAVQYLGNIALGITLSLLPGARKKVAHPTKTILPPPCHPPSFGLLLKNAALKSAQNIALIGCYMAFFSVLTTM
ncbi:MAG: nucleoside recognition domain-containing protein, partial [Clostridiales bacterium]